MTRAEAIALGLAVMLIISVFISRTTATRMGALMITGGMLAIALVVFHQWSR